MPVNVKIRLNIIIVILFISAVFFTTCDSPLGMGLPIDFEPPVLTLYPKPSTPFYVGLGAELTGTVSDNVGVDRVILRNSVSGAQIFTATLLSNDRWEIKLTFSPEQNGETILADVVAFDKMGNSGAESIASVVLIIDIRPPVVEDIWIQRSPTKTADLYPYSVFDDPTTNPKTGLIITDPNGEISDNVNKYQNGAFNIKAKLSEEETRIESVYLKIYDIDYPDDDDVLLSLEPESGSSLYSPQWYVTEDMILNAGTLILKKPNYVSEYKVNNKRYYYRVRIVATDKGKNKSEVTEEGGREIIEDKGYFCLWNQADYPKGILDPVVVGKGNVLTKGSSLPIEFFDDDKIVWAYAALFTKEQWNGKNDKNQTVYIAPGVTFSGTNDEKLEFLKNRLVGGQDVYNWRYDRYNEALDANKIVNLISAPVDDKLHYIVTGNAPVDYGDFVLVTIVKDKKQSPHIASEYPDIIKYKRYELSLVDENAPLIVFDKEHGSPEENTFPTLDTSGNFKIHGYTLREDKGQAGVNQVEFFRLAWIPFEISNGYGGPEANIPVVKKALEEGTGFPDEVQWWDLSADVKASAGYERIPDTTEGTYFRKQLFSKTFNILGNVDSDKTEYDNFTRVKGNRSTFENATKLFVFYAEDNMGHNVFTQFYLLGNKTPPTIDIWDITDKLEMSYNSSDTSHTNSPPSVYEDSPLEGKITDAYTTKRTAFNVAKYSTLKSAASSVSNSDLTNTYRAYPRGTIVKFWAKAKANGALSIKTISMVDITYADPLTHKEVGYYGGSTDSAYSYVEYFPEVSQRVFEFTITDELGNVAKVQRTIAIASASTLTSIITAKQNGTYPAGEEIILKANFDGLIKLQSNDASTKPKLNVLYNVSGVPKVEQITCENVVENTGQLYLEFKFTVPANADGQLLTIYKGLANPEGFDKPIEVTTGNNILDARPDGGTAYTPGNVTGFFWDTVKNSLQYDAIDNPNGKTIMLDGVAPTITVINIVNTKAALTTGNWYLKNTESISFELTSNKNLKVTGEPSLRFRLQRPNNAGYTTYDTTHFNYSKVTTNKVVFTLDVSRTSIPYDGILQDDITIVNPTFITDNVGNPIDVSANSTFTTVLSTFTQGKTVYFDLTPPPQPTTTLQGTGQSATTVGSTPLVTLPYSTSPTLGITNPTTAQEPYGTSKRRYSLDGGLTWVDFPLAKDGWTTVDAYNALKISNGQWSLKTQFIDNAGNEGPTTDQLIHVNSKFPTLLGVKVVQPNATYKGGQTLQFTLDFDDTVTATSAVTLTLDDMSDTNDTTGGTSPTYRNVLNATAITDSRTVTFTWTLAANSKDMIHGLKITALNINALKDKFGNNGPATTTVTSTTVNIDGTNNVTYNFSGIKVSTITPRVSSSVPVSAYNRTGNITTSVSSDNKTITLTFTKPMQKGNGTITIKPHAGYAIPALFENDGYYVNYTYSGNNVTAETRQASSGADFTYVSGLYDIFNSSLINDADRNTLISATSMSLSGANDLSLLTGLSKGPYLRTTNGLKKGAGYTGNYGNYGTDQTTPTNALPGINAPGPDNTATYMIPDPDTKWVLDYQYANTFDTTNNSTVNNIRNVLTKAEWRYQKIAVTSNNVVIGTGSDENKKTVTITLPEPLLPGLRWDVTYPATTFTDEAGNPAAAESSYWFWSKGVQTPVIRVNRLSYDARPSAEYNKSTYGNGFRYQAIGYNGQITDFNTINYMITSETPQARISHIQKAGSSFTGGLASVTGAWTGNAVTVNTDKNITVNTTINWNGPLVANNATPTNYTIGTWVRQNLIFRSRNDSANNYVTMTDPVVNHYVKGNSDTNRFYGFRSYNRDALSSELEALTPTNTGTNYSTYYTNSFTYSALEASKSYVVAQADIDHTDVQSGGTHNYSLSHPLSSSQRSYEGVFRTVVMFNQDYLGSGTGADSAANDGSNPITDNDGNRPMMISGSNVRNGTPTIAGFPIKDGNHRIDSRYVKFFYRNGKTFYWVTSEIISAWYFQQIARGNGYGTSSTTGDIEDWMSGGYGDLSYAFNFR